MYASHDGQAEDGLLRLNRVPTDDGDSRFGGFVRGAAEDVAQNRRRELLIGEADQIQGSQGFSAHGVDVAEGIGSCNSAEIVWSIDDGGEEIGGQNQGQVVVELVDGRIVRRRAAHENFGIGNFGQHAQKREQIARRLLRCASRSFGELGQADWTSRGCFVWLGHEPFASGSSRRQQPRSR